MNYKNVFRTKITLHRTRVTKNFSEVESGAVAVAPSVATSRQHLSCYYAVDNKFMRVATGGHWGARPPLLWLVPPR